MQTCKFALKTSFMLSSRPTWASTTIELLLMISALLVYHPNTWSSNPPLPILVMLLVWMDLREASCSCSFTIPGSFFIFTHSTIQQLNATIVKWRSIPLSQDILDQRTRYRIHSWKTVVAWFELKPSLQRGCVMLQYRSYHGHHKKIGEVWVNCQVFEILGGISRNSIYENMISDSCLE